MKRKNEKHKRTGGHHGAAWKRCIGVIIAVVLIIGTVVGAIGPDKLFSMRAEAGTAPMIEILVTKKDQTEYERERSVHIDLETFDEVFTYEILAYITENADRVTITQKIDEALEFKLPDNDDVTIREIPVAIVDDMDGETTYFRALDAVLRPATEDGSIPMLGDAGTLALPYGAVSAALDGNELEVIIDIAGNAAQEDNKTAYGEVIVPQEAAGTAGDAAQGVIDTSGRGQQATLASGDNPVAENANQSSVYIVPPVSGPATEEKQNPEANAGDLNAGAQGSQDQNVEAAPEIIQENTQENIQENIQENTQENIQENVTESETEIVWSETELPAAVPSQDEPLAAVEFRQEIPAQEVRQQAAFETLRGNWVHLMFDVKMRNTEDLRVASAARILEKYQKPDYLVSGDENKPVQDPNMEEHRGIQGSASYLVTPVPDVSSGRSATARSNIVTVMPGTHKATVYASVEDSDHDLDEAQKLRETLGLFVRSASDPENESNVTGLLGDNYEPEILFDEEHGGRWEIIWNGLPVIDSDTEYIVKVFDTETGTWFIDEFETKSGETEILVPSGSKKTKRARTLKSVSEETRAFVNIIWDNAGDPNPPDSVSLNVRAIAESGGVIKETIYTVDGEDSVLRKGSDPMPDADSEVTAQNGAWKVKIAGLPKEIRQTEEETALRTVDGEENTVTEEPYDSAAEEPVRLKYEVSAGAVAAKTGSYTVSESGGDGTDENDPVMIVYHYNAPEVTVTMPDVTLRVNDMTEAELETMTETVTYTITTTVPEEDGVTLLTIKDRLKDGMRFAGRDGDVKVQVEDLAYKIDRTTEVTDPEDETVTLKTVLNDEQELTVRIPVNDETKGRQVTVSFRASVKDNITYDGLSAIYKDARIPNEAETFAGTFSQPNLGAAKSETVTIQPLSTARGAAAASDVTLTVNGSREHTDLTARDDLFTYLIETKIPEGAASMTITDTLEPVLKNMSKHEEIIVKVGNKVITPSTEVVQDNVAYQAVTLDGQTVRVRVPVAKDDADKDKSVTVQLKAVIRSDMDLASYESRDGKIPNEASVEVDGDTAHAKKSNEVTVRPPSTPGVTKTVNGTDNYTLEGDSDLLSYSISARIPLDAETYELTDSVPAVLEVKSASAKVGGKSFGSANLKKRGQDVIFTLPNAGDYAGEPVEMKVKTKLVKDADLALYNDHKVPNTVTVSVNGRLYEKSEPATVDGEVLGMRRRGGQTGEESEVPRLIAIVLALGALIILAKHRVNY